MTKPDNSPGNTSIKLETTASYQIGKTTVSVNRVFRQENAETLYNILMRLIQKEAGNP